MTSGHLLAAMGRHYLKTAVQSRRSLVAGLLFALTLAFLAVGAVTFTGESHERLALFGSFQFLGPLGFLVQFGSLFYGIAVVSEELENGTLPYLLVRPIPRWNFLIGRTVAAFATVLLTLTVMNLVLLALVRPAPLAPAFLAAQLALLLGCGAYVSLFTCFSTLFKKPLAPALLFLVMWEMGLSMVPLKARYVTVKFHLMSLYNGLAGPASGHGVADKFFARCDLDPTTSIVVLLAVTVTALLVSLRKFNRIQF